MRSRALSLKGVSTKLEEITEKTHPVFIDLKYASNTNFTGKKIYKKARCLLHPDALRALEKAIVLADQQGFKFRIIDAFRPPKAQEVLWSIFPNPNYIAHPVKGSCHSRGVSVDLELVGAHNETLDFGTQVGEMTPDSYHGVAHLSPEALKNRYLLLGIMISAGWGWRLNEWWHYHLPNINEYPIITDSYDIL